MKDVMKEFVKVIRDPVHGYIGITSEETKLLDLPVLQRLRQIGQLSFVDLVYPDSQHSRLGHSLGTMHLCSKYGEHFASLRLFENNKNDEYMRLLRLAGLLHDIGHGPFSHAFEPAFYQYVMKDSLGWHDAHVRFGKTIITEPKYGIIGIIGENTANDIADLISGNVDNFPGFFLKVMKGLFCADRLDYLQRDAYHMGAMEYSIIDSERIIRSLHLHDNEPRYSKNGLYALEGAVLSYYYLYRAAYYHHTTRAAYSLFTEMTWDIFERETSVMKENLEPERFIYFSDYLFTEIAKEHTCMKMLLKRNLPKVLFGESDFEKYSDILEKASRVLQNDFTIKRNIEHNIRKKTGVQLLFLDTPSFIPYPLDSREPHIVLDKQKPLETKKLSSLSPILKALKAEYVNQIPRIYIDGESYQNNIKRIDKFKEEIITITWEVLGNFTDEKKEE